MNKSKIQKLNFYSNILEKEMSLIVYLPKDYNNSTSFPVLYFLHGRSGNENFINTIEINKSADKMVEEKLIKPMLIVSPRLENSRGINSSSKPGHITDPQGRKIDTGMYEDYFIKEVIPLIDKTFKTINNRKARFIGGASAGGYSALHNGFRHQDLFSKIGGHMPAIELHLEEEDKGYFSKLETWKKYDPITIAKNNEIYPDMEIYLDAGDKDEGAFYHGCNVLYKILKSKGIKCQNHIFKGHHDFAYIKSNIEKYLKFYGA